MSRAAAWRLSGPAVRYDYAPRSWDNHHRWHMPDLGRRENLWPIARKVFKLATITAIGLGILYSGMSLRVEYLGDGTVRFERKPIWSSAATGPALSMVGAMATSQNAMAELPALPAPGSKPGTLDAAPASTSGSQSDVCRANRQSVSAAVAAYNKKFPATPVRSLQMLSQVDGDVPDLAACPTQGKYVLQLKGAEPLVRCSAHE